VILGVLRQNDYLRAEDESRTETDLKGEAATQFGVFFEQSVCCEGNGSG
tara:strand:- start:416 stop:562 length:147 start_codon:yes stop_codon:yes gene_type:complete